MVRVGVGAEVFSHHAFEVLEYLGAVPLAAKPGWVLLEVIVVARNHGCDAGGALGARFRTL